MLAIDHVEVQEVYGLDVVTTLDVELLDLFVYDNVFESFFLGHFLFFNILLVH